MLVISFPNVKSEATEGNLHPHIGKTPSIASGNLFLIQPSNLYKTVCEKAPLVPFNEPILVGATLIRRFLFHSIFCVPPLVFSLGFLLV